MKYSQIFGKTSKTEGTDLVVDSHRLLTQAGYIRESRAGRYFMLPLGQIVHDNIKAVVKKHIDKLGAQEMVTPVLHPRELWAETNRTSAAGYELMGIKDRRGADFVLGGTAEEMMVDVVRKFNISYKDLPFSIYQFSMKFRDELRASGGLLRVREFVMKDAYSYSTAEQFKDTYQQYWDAYDAIFTELGLKTDPSLADNGYIGGEYCHEFIAPSPVGESRYFYNDKTKEHEHEDVAVFSKDIDYQYDSEQLPLETKVVERGTTMDEGVRVHGVEMPQHIKNVVFKTSDRRIVLASLRGDLEVNKTKLAAAIPDREMAGEIEPLTNEEVATLLGSVPGFMSQIGIRDLFEKAQSKIDKDERYTMLMIADDSVPMIVNGISGANQDGQDYINMNYDRDWTADIVADIAMAYDGAPAKDGGKLKQKIGIEVGNIFQLGTHYTGMMKGCDYMDENGKPQPIYMGCYGIGIGRTLAAIVETHHDDNGIVWPEAVAPFKYHIVTIAKKVDDPSYIESQKLYDALIERGETVLWDDRLKVRPGEKFADSDLIGCPTRIVISHKTVESNSAEVKQRSATEPEMISLNQI